MKPEGEKRSAINREISRLASLQDDDIEEQADDVNREISQTVSGIVPRLHLRRRSARWFVLRREKIARQERSLENSTVIDETEYGDFETASAADIEAIISMQDITFRRLSNEGKLTPQWIEYGRSRGLFK